MFDIEDGLATTRALAIQTDKLKIAARGSLNLATEEVDLGFKIGERKGIGISAASLFSPLVSLSGTLAEPAVTVDEGATALAVVTEGWTLVLAAMAGLFQSGTNICDLELKRYERKKRREQRREP